MKVRKNFDLALSLSAMGGIMLPVLTVSATPKHEITRHSIAGGGVMRSTGGNLELSATIGQPESAVLSGGGIELTGGFWLRLSPMDCDENGSVGYLDHRRYVECAAGPGEPTSDACPCLDANASDTVDLFDWGVFQRAFNDASPPPTGDPTR